MSRSFQKQTNGLNLKLENDANNTIDYAYCFQNAVISAYDTSPNTISKAMILNDIILNSRENKETMYSVGSVSYSLKDVCEICNSLVYFILIFDSNYETSEVEKIKSYIDRNKENSYKRMLYTRSHKIALVELNNFDFFYTNVTDYVENERYNKFDSKKAKDSMIYSYMGDVIADFILYDKQSWFSNYITDVYQKEVYEIHKNNIKKFHVSRMASVSDNELTNHIIATLLKEKLKNLCVNWYNILYEFIEFQSIKYKDCKQKK